MSLPRVQPDGGGGHTLLAEMGTNVLEFSTVSRITGDPKYRQQAEKGLRSLHGANQNVRRLRPLGPLPHQPGARRIAAPPRATPLTSPTRSLPRRPAAAPACLTLPCQPTHPCPRPSPQALLLESVDRQSARESGWVRGVGAGTDSYYEYLIKYWVLGGRQDEHWRRRWEASVDEALEKLVVTPPGWPFSFAGDMRGEQVDSVLEHLRCFYPGSVALGVMSGAVQGPKAERYLQFAANMTQACFQLYNTTASGGYCLGVPDGVVVGCGTAWLLASFRCAHTPLCMCASLPGHDCPCAITCLDVSPTITRGAAQG